ncbi:MAG: alanine--tRNA ligase [Nitrospirales bacterium]|nr:alanine--tRNA ligase [Nitrospirales bacterium]
MNRDSTSLRQSFLDYFAQYAHVVVPSAPLIPQADPTLLFTNAGMNQFKRVFLGEEVRSYQRAVSVQKCMRAGGKHNDLENVGYTRRHHTFFEMLGNFSFGDYFKEEAVRFGWEYLTKVLELPSDRLWVTIYREDDEAHRLWAQNVGVPSSRIVRLGEKDNFWQMGETGPCGPCSEILIDQGEALGCGMAACAVGCDCDRYLEIWNLVFMQYDRDKQGILHPLPRPSIDTGMGLERLTAVAQGVSSNYDSDLFMPMLSCIADRTKHVYGQDLGKDRSIRVIADHLRAMTFLITDGILPSNEGRGYVLRRILRRASRHGRLLGVVEPFLYDLTKLVVEQLGKTYPELQQSAAVIREVVEGEEERFIGTLDQGLPLLNDLVNAAVQGRLSLLEGQSLFKLYDTYGFPLDLIEEAAREHHLQVDHEGFQNALARQREQARKATAFRNDTIKPIIQTVARQVQPTQFIGYHTLNRESLIQAILRDDQLIQEAVEGEAVEVLLDVTPFYPEGGGQVGDQGFLYGTEGTVHIQETSKAGHTLLIHKGVVQSGRIRNGDRVSATVNSTTRQDAAKNHTATHLVHAALREILGPHVKQYGSLVAPNRLRFDFAHFKPLSLRDIDAIETLVNQQIQENTTVQTEELVLQDAMDSGALAFFGDKYGEKVRVVGIGSFSKELCGGTHCQQTGEIGQFKVIAEGGVAAGIRRIEGLTGNGALHYGQQMEFELRELAGLLKTTPGEVLPKTKKLVALLKDKERELEQLRMKDVDQESGQIQRRVIHGLTIHAQQVDGLSIQELRVLSDKIRHTLPSGVITLASTYEGKVSILVVVTKDWTDRVQAGDVIKEMAQEVGGTGGGRPEMAQAGGKNPEGIQRALEKIFEQIEKRIS